ncbi:MAG: ATP-binding protein [Bacteroidetes bacterium]|nr:ATP-binding protein [Bacteroidota bacterium]MDA0950095.1 ATP-binding protein [Bacteroidota bacterium]
MVHKVKTFVKVYLDLRSSLMSLTLTKGFGAKCSGMPQHMLRDQFDRLRVLLHQRKQQLKGMRYVFQSQITASAKHHQTSEMAIAALLIASCAKEAVNHIEQTYFVGSFDLQGRAIPLDYPHEYYVAALSVGCEYFVLPLENIKDLPVEIAPKTIGIQSIDELINYVLRCSYSTVYKESECINTTHESVFYYDQPHASRALELSIVGRHHLLLFGEPGIGKSTLIDHYAKTLPLLTREQKLSLWPIQVKRMKRLSYQLPVEHMKVNTSIAELYGGGVKPYPGYISLAHHVILVADEIDQYSRSVLEALKPSLEWKEVLLERNNYSISYPSEFTLIGSCNTDLENTHNGLFSDSFIDRIDLMVKLQKPNIGQEPKPFNYTQISQRLEQALLYKTSITSSFGGAQPLDCLHRIPITKEGMKMVQQLKSRDKTSVRRINRWLSTALSLLYIDQLSSLNEGILSEALSFRKWN